MQRNNYCLEQVRSRIGSQSTTAIARHINCVNTVLCKQGLPPFISPTLGGETFEDKVYEPVQSVPITGSGIQEAVSEC